MTSLKICGKLWVINGDDLHAIIMALANISISFMDNFDEKIGVTCDCIRSLNSDVFNEIMDGNVVPGARPAPCIPPKIITGVRRGEDEYLLDISPEGLLLLVNCLTADLNEIEEWEFETRHLYPRSTIIALRDRLKEAIH